MLGVVVLYVEVITM